MYNCINLSETSDDAMISPLFLELAFERDKMHMRLNVVNVFVPSGHFTPNLNKDAASTCEQHPFQEVNLNLLSLKFELFLIKLP